jgi:anti-sigma factor RsiW
MLHEYLDGELSPESEATFESHAANCPDCRIEIELHRKLAAGIEQLADEEIKLPDNFSKVVAANAESQVSGLRKSKERSVTFAILAGLTILIFCVLGASFGAAARLAGFVFERIVSVVLVIGSFFSDLVLGIIVVARVAVTQFEFNTQTVIAILGVGLGILLVICLIRAGRASLLREVK